MQPDRSASLAFPFALEAGRLEIRVLDAKDQAAIRFHERFGLEMLADTERRMFLTLKTVQALLRT